MRSIHMRRAARRSMRGLSIVEILAAMLVGLIGMTIIMQVYSVSEERKRTTTGTGDAQITGSIAMFTLERELRDAGFGLITTEANMLGCTVAAYDSTRAVMADPSDGFPTMAPVAITVGGGGAPDSFTLIYGSSFSAAEATAFSGPAPKVDAFPLKNSGGFQIGDFVVAHRNGACHLAEVTGFTVGSLNSVEHGVGAAYSYVDINGATVNATARYNDAGVSGSHPADTMLFSLGRNPVVRQYYIDDDKLKTRTLLPYDAAQDTDGDGWADSEIADGIVQMKLQYGKDTDADRIVDAWNTAEPTTQAEWLQVRAVRIALLARSGQYEKTDVTADEPEWYGGAFTMTDPADGTDWHRYRYRVYQTVVPFRNMIWSNDPL